MSGHGLSERGAHANWAENDSEQADVGEEPAKIRKTPVQSPTARGDCASGGGGGGHHVKGLESNHHSYACPASKGNMGADDGKGVKGVEDELVRKRPVRR